MTKGVIEARQITVRVQFFGSICEAVGIPSVTVSLPQSAIVANLVDELRLRFTKAFENFEISEGYYSILLNGQNIAFLDGTKTRLLQDSTVSFLPMFAGG